MNILSERCMIRDFCQEDIGDFMEYRNDMEWMRYQGYKGKSRENYENDLLSNTSLTKGRQLAIVDTADNRLIGDIYVKKENRAFWLGFTIHPAYAQKGYAKEAVGAMIKWVAGQNGSAIKAGVLPGNTASIGLLEKLGFLCSGNEDGELIYTYAVHKND